MARGAIHFTEAVAPPVHATFGEPSVEDACRKLMAACRGGDRHSDRIMHARAWTKPISCRRRRCRRHRGRRERWRTGSASRTTPDEAGADAARSTWRRARRLGSRGASARSIACPAVATSRRTSSRSSHRPSWFASTARPRRSSRGWLKAGRESDDGLRYTIKLRPNLAFSDGQPFSADDVVFSFAAVYDAKAGSGLADALKVGGRPVADRQA